MFTTKGFANNKDDVNSAWVFQYYLNLPERLNGQDIKIKSIFNPNERTASMCIYLCNYTNEYKFKDFSSGKQGSKIDLVSELFNLDYSKSLFRIVEDWNKWCMDNGKFNADEFTPAPKYKVDFALPRKWNKEDADYWMQFNIRKKVLTKYNVKPLEYFTMIKEGDVIEKIKITNGLIYGYYNNNKVYKIYQPYSSRNKFTKVSEYLQGVDQLEDSMCLVIVSSLKDGMCIQGMDFALDFVAPDSENTLIKPHIIINLKERYKKVISLLDNDECGQSAMKRYEELYDIKPIYIKSEKDISDAVKKYGVEAVKPKLQKLIDDAKK